MKTEEDDASPAAIAAATDIQDNAATRPETKTPEAATGARLQTPQKRTVCDHCRRRSKTASPPCLCLAIVSLMRALGGVWYQIGICSRWQLF